MTKFCAYCMTENFGAGLASCRGCGSPMVIGCVKARCEREEIEGAVNRRGPVYFGGTKRGLPLVILFPAQHRYERRAWA